MRMDRRNVPKEVNPRISTSPLPTGIIELYEVRYDLLIVFGIWIHVLSGLEQRQVFGAKFFLQFVYLLGQRLSFLAVFLLVGLVELITEIEDLAIDLDFSLIATDDADDILCQFGSIRLLSLSKQRRRQNNQNPEDQQPVHKFPRGPQATIPQKTEESLDAGFTRDKARQIAARISPSCRNCCVGGDTRAGSDVRFRG